jgi:phospholipase/lecithinase/hemolysin
MGSPYEEVVVDRTILGTMVQFQPVFDEAVKRAPADYWIWDRVHPTYRGHQLMADEWERAVRDAWK